MVFDLLQCWPVHHTVSQHLDYKIFEIIGELYRPTVLNNTFIIFILVTPTVWNIPDCYDQIKQSFEERHQNQVDEI